MTIKQIDSANLSVKKVLNDNDGKNYTALCTEIFYQSKAINYKKGQIEALLKLEVFRINARKEYNKIISSTDEVEELALSIDDYYSVCMARLHRGYAFLHFRTTGRIKKNSFGCF